MPIKAYEFTKSTDLIAQKKDQVDQMRQAALQANDPVQMQLANSQTLIDTLFGDPEIQKAQEIETVISDSMNLEKQEGEDDLDFQIRQQQAVRDGTAKLDPNVALQANSNLRQLITEAQEQEKLKVKEARDTELFNFKINKLRDEQTPVIERYDPMTGQWEMHEVGEYGSDGLAMAERAKALTAAANDGQIFAVSNKSQILNREKAPDEEESVSGNIGKTEARKFRKAYGDQIDALDSALPLLEQLAENPRALQGVAMDNNGNMKSSEVNGLFQTLESIGQRAQLAMKKTGYAGKFYDSAGRSYDLSTFVSEKLRAAGIESRVAESRVIALAYAVAKSRDSGRLSDQDVSLALKSLIGNGGAREIAILFGDLARSARGITGKLEDFTADDPGILNTRIRARFQASYDGILGALDRLNSAADEIGQPEAGGSTSEDMRNTAEFNTQMTNKWLRGGS
jgi:hypothetical protein